ncbi:MAG: PD40 domain-containing protein [Opitutaceae bacterium]|nr:PD40 domain-containing protein [Opitutaceae bacterium]
MIPRIVLPCLLTVFTAAAFCTSADAQIGRRFPSERKVVIDPVTGTPLTFLTSTPAGDSKIYPTHPQWTADGQWLVFRSNRVRGQAMAVNEATGDIVQVTETGYQGALCIAQKSMRLFFTRREDHATFRPEPPQPGQRPNIPPAPMQVVAIDLGRLFADSAAGALKPAASYETIFGTIPVEIGGAGELALDANEDYVYFRIVKEGATPLLPAGTKIEDNFGPRNMGAGPTGVAKMELATGKVSPVVVVPFQVGHIQSNPWKPGEIVFCWETGGKSPQRTWTVMADGTGLRPLFPEAPYDWVTHEAVIGPDEVAIAILGHRKPGTSDGWGPSGTREHPTGLGIVNLRTREMMIVGQTRGGSGHWHVHGSADGRWAVGDDFARNLWLIDRRTGEQMLLTTGHKVTAADHIHPTFSADGTRVQIQSAMLSVDDRSMNICIVPVPKAWLERTYDEKVHPATFEMGRP